MRFRNQLLLLVLSILIPAFLASAWAVWYVYTSEQEEQEKNLLETARGFAMVVESDLKIREATLRTLASSPLLESGDLRTFYAYARSLAPSHASTIILRHESGRQLLNTRRPLGEELPVKSASNLAALRESHSPNDTVVSDVFVAQVAKRFDFAIQVPVRANRHSYSYVEMGVNASELQPILFQQRFPASWITTVVDRRGVVLARSHDPEHFVGKMVRERSRQVLSSARQGVYHSITLDEIPVKAFYSRVPLADWSVLISIPEAELRQIPVRVASFLAASMVLLLAIAVFAAGWLARRSITPMEELGRAAENMARNEEVVYTGHGVHEIDAVGRQIAQASIKIRQATVELERRVAAASSKAERAERALQESQKLEALGRLTGGIAHEFNNLLQTISSAVQLARLLPQPDRVVPLMDTCSKAVERATALTSQLSAFGRTQEAKLATISLNRQLEEFRQLVKNVLPSNIRLDFRLSGVSWPVTVDTLQFELAFLNVVINARDAMPAGGTLTVETSNRQLQHGPAGLPPGEYVRITIRDTGEGMPAEVLARAFEPFYTTKPAGKGTGLGLAQAYGFARQSRGALVLNSVEGQGTSVEFYLPRAASEPAQEHDDKGPAHAAPRASGTVLFVEDDELVRNTMVPALQNAGLQVVEAANADEALAILGAGRRVDAVLSDVMMPGKMSGVQLAQAILGQRDDIKVVLATGYSDYEINIPGVKVIAKPYQVGDVIELLQDS